MNTKEFNVEMVRHGDTIGSLARFLGISQPCLCNKKNAKGNAQFTQKEIQLIATRWEIGSKRLIDIFFSGNSSCEDEKE